MCLRRRSFRVSLPTARDRGGIPVSEFWCVAFFCRPRLMCQQRSRDAPDQREERI